MGSHKRLQSKSVTSNGERTSEVEMTPTNNNETPLSKEEKRLMRLLLVFKEHKKNRESGERKEHHQKLFKTPKEVFPKINYQLI
jgi:hypothetical protein